jgi:M6 family metalloprotease-like protein
MVGFPIASTRLPNIGKVNVQVLFVDFPDYQGTMTDEELETFFQSYIEGINTFFDTQSFGRMTFQFDRHPGFLRMSRPTSELALNRIKGPRDLDGVIREAIRVSDEFVDYSSTDMVIVFMNPDIPESVADVSPAWPMSEGGGFVTNEGTVYNATIIAGDGVRIGYATIAHEIGHLFGLADLYAYDWQVNNPSNDWLFQFVYTGLFDFMSMGDPNQFGDNRDMLAWQRYLLDWISNEQVRCVDPNTPSQTTHELIASHLNEDGSKMVVFPFTVTKALVVEVKARNRYCVVCSGGVYTYVVDTEINNGAGPIRFVRPNHSNQQLFQDAYLTVGQQLVYENITITIEAQGATTIVQVDVKEKAA